MKATKIRDFILLKIYTSFFSFVLPKYITLQFNYRFCLIEPSKFIPLKDRFLYPLMIKSLITNFPVLMNRKSFKDFSWKVNPEEELEVFADYNNLLINTDLSEQISLEVATKRSRCKDYWLNNTIKVSQEHGKLSSFTFFATKNLPEIKTFVTDTNIITLGFNKNTKILTGSTIIGNKRESHIYVKYVNGKEDILKIKM